MSQVLNWQDIRRDNAHPDPNQKSFVRGEPAASFARVRRACLIPMIVVVLMSASGALAGPPDWPARREKPRPAPGKTLPPGPPAPKEPDSKPSEKQPAPSDGQGSKPDEMQEEGKRVFGTGGGGGTRSGDGSSSADAGVKGCFIVLESYAGSGHAEAAAARLPAVREALGREVRVRTSEKGSAIITGSFPSADSPAAVEALSSVRGVVIDGQRPYALAFLAPAVAEADVGALPELNLTSARRTFGRQAKYTLQIGVYESKNPAERKRAAEQAAVILRREGDLAFYYHGPTRSMVTVGIFGDKDFDQFSRPRSPLLAALQEKYPLNLLNGQYPIIERVPGQGGAGRQQPSGLVSIPD